MQQIATRLRCDPTDYAKQQQLKKDRAKQLREQRQHGLFSDEHTFSPKVNQRTRNQSSPPVSREGFERVVKSDSMTFHNSDRNNNYPELLDASGDDVDALENLSRKYLNRAPHQQMASLHLRPPKEEHDSLFKEVKRATGREIADLPIKEKLVPPPKRIHTGPCLRNSSCGCPKCDAGFPSSSYVNNVNAEALSLCQREPRMGLSGYRQNDCSANEMGNSLALLKSRMSRRKARSAPTNKTSLFVEKNIPSAVVHSARLPLSSPISSDAPSQPPRQNIASRRAPVQPVMTNKNLTENFQANSSTFTGFNLPEELDEYADGTEEMEQCHNCNRKFNPASFQKHRKICEKVFSGQRKVFNMAAKRLEGTEAEKVLKEAKSNKKNSGLSNTPMSAMEIPIKVKNAADWKQKSDMFRNAMKASREVSKALKEGKELPPMQPSAPDPSLIQCEYCSRRFNEKAAERHINFCREKSQRDIIKGGAKRVPAAKPGSRAASSRKR
ncbi:putative Zinc finger C2HC domain-containing protein [Plasmopara halstedii]